MEDRIGVYVCHCGTNIAATVDVENVMKFAAGLKDVVVARDYKYMCSAPGQSMIKKDVKELGLNKIVVAACSPAIHEETYRKICEAAGVNGYLFQMANIREQCSWTTNDIKTGTEKAKRIVTAAVNRIRYHEALTPKEVPVNPNALVVGGGIAGIESALQIATSGRKVYLVEKEPSIGGHMSQFDKTFPTLDCAACILTPKMATVGSHPNIEILSYSEVVDVSGYIGNFKVKVKRKPRYIDLEKCTACGLCVEKCPVQKPNDFDYEMSTRKAIYIPFPQAVPKAYVIDKRGLPPCRVTCPAGVNVQGYIALLSQGKTKEALNLVRNAIPLPAVCGRVCFHPCEDKCERGQVDEPIAINALKRFIADYETKEGVEKPQPIPKKHEEKTAIIGSGPAGLAAAYELVKMGYPVIVFESLPEPGGMLRVGIPEYRLPKGVLAAEIRYLQDLGVEIKTNAHVDKQMFDALKKSYKAIFVSTGAHRSTRLGIEGEELKGVMPALSFLKDVNLGKKAEMLGAKSKVAVIGGGNVAIDAARSALRLGAGKVSILYRRSREEMPAYPHEVEQAELEGVELNFLVAPKRVLGKNGQVVGLECVRMALGEPDESGRRRPMPVAGSEFTVDVDVVMTAIGEVPDLSIPPGAVASTKRGTLTVDPLTMETSLPGVFAGGDVASGPATVIEAFAAGKRAAVSISRFLRGEDLRAGREEEVKKVEKVSKKGVQKKPRKLMPTLSVEQRKGNFKEIELGFTEEMAKEEAARCLMCGGCAECLECEKACEPQAIIHRQKEEYIDLDVGTIVIATGYKLFDATKAPQFGYKIYDNVLHGLEFERLSNASGPTGGKILLKNGKPPSSVAILHCIGSRDENYNPYCSRVCCMYSMKFAHLVREKVPGAKVYEFYIDVRAFGKGYEEFYKRILNENVFFIRGKGAEVTDVAESPREEGKLIVKCEDTLLGKVRRIPVDMVVLATAIEPAADSQEVARLFSIERSRDGFYLERHIKLAPVATMTDGIFIAGVCQGPKDIPDSVAQGGAAAAEALSLIDRGKAKIEPTVSVIDEELCGGCKTCVSICPYKAIQYDEEKNVSRVEEAICKGCGLCVAACPSGAAMQRGFTNRQIEAEIEGALMAKEV